MYSSRKSFSKQCVNHLSGDVLSPQSSIITFCSGRRGRGRGRGLMDGGGGTGGTACSVPSPPNGSNGLSSLEPV